MLKVSAGLLICSDNLKRSSPLGRVDGNPSLQLTDKAADLLAVAIDNQSGKDTAGLRRFNLQLLLQRV